MSPYEPRNELCVICGKPFAKTTSTMKYCSPKCCAQNTHNTRRLNVPNPRTLSEIESEWLPEAQRLLKAGILVNGLTAKTRTKQNAERIEAKHKKTNLYGR